MKISMIFLLSCCWFVIGQVHADLSFKESAKHKTAEGAYNKHLVTYELPGETHNKLTFRFDASKAGMPQGHYVLEIKMAHVYYYMLRKAGEKYISTAFLFEQLDFSGNDWKEAFWSNQDNNAYFLLALFEILVKRATGKITKQALQKKLKYYNYDHIQKHAKAHPRPVSIEDLRQGLGKTNQEIFELSAEISKLEKELEDAKRKHHTTDKKQRTQYRFDANIQKQYAGSLVIKSLTATIKVHDYAIVITCGQIPNQRERMLQFSITDLSNTKGQFYMVKCRFDNQAFKSKVTKSATNLYGNKKITNQKNLWLDNIINALIGYLNNSDPSELENKLTRYLKR